MWNFNKIFALFLVFLALLVVGAQLTLPKLPPMQQLLGKAKDYQVEILRDNLGIPHVYGKKDVDTAFGLGYAQSEDDFVTLQSVLLATRGQLAAERGYSSAKTDFIVEFMGVWQTVNEQYEKQVPPQIKAIAQAYADGVNTFAAQNPNSVSRYLLPVTAKDIIAGFTFKTPMFYGFDQALGELLNPEYPHEFAKNDSSLSWQPSQQLPIGSQGIAIAPHRSADGATRLLVNSHQPLTGAVAWYEARLHSEEGWNMVGSTFPGAPVIIHGHNANLGWANTVNKPDLVDFYKMTINPNNENEYWLDGQWHLFEIKTAEILVKILGPIRWTFEKEIKIAKHGPVMETEHGDYAVRWAGMNEVRQLESLFTANKSTTKNEFETALKMNAMPSINFVYADREGNIGHYYNAKFPKRIDGWQWNKILPGDRSELIWNDYHDFQVMPKTLNPKSGLVFNANNPPDIATDGNDDAKIVQLPRSMGIESFVTNRAFQIESLLAPLDRISDSDLKAVKFDLSYHPESNQILLFNEWLAIDHSQMFSNIEQAAKQALKNWNRSTDKSNRLAALAILTLKPIQRGRGKNVDFILTTLAFKAAVADLNKYHGHYEVALGDVIRIKRGELNLAISGGPDILRAVYPDEIDDRGQAENIAGDGFMMFVAWDSNGLLSSEAAHQYGAATALEKSSHYNDQMNDFVEHKLRKVLFKRNELEKHITRQYRPGR